eukprot:g5539.t1
MERPEKYSERNGTLENGLGCPLRCRGRSLGGHPRVHNTVRLAPRSVQGVHHRTFLQPSLPGVLDALATTLAIRPPAKRSRIMTLVFTLYTKNVTPGGLTIFTENEAATHIFN